MEDVGQTPKQHLGYRLLYGIAYLHALLPFSVLYVLSDVLFLVVYYLVRYRRRLVRKNIQNAFPERTEKEIRQIERKFYRHLCDYAVETVKMLHFSDKEARKRMKFENPEIINRLTKNGNSCILSLGHYGNWEWVTSIGLYLLPGVEQGFVYKQLKSKAFDELFLRIRSRFSPKAVEMRNVFRKMIATRNEGKTMVVGFITDQRPSHYSDEYWTQFLHQDSLVRVGMERIARQLKLSVVYLDIEKVKRGYYVGKFYVITPDAAQEPEFAVMERYMRRLEETVLREPAYYLWSHNRWKFKRVGDA